MISKLPINLENLLRQRQVEGERFEDKNLIVLWAPGGLNRPYKAPKAVTARNKEYHYYIRRYSSTVEARGDIEHELISLTAKVPFDDRFNQGAKLEDLSPRLMTEFLRDVGSELADEAHELSIEALGRQLNVMGGPAETPVPLNVGLLFFNDEPRRFFPATQKTLELLRSNPTLGRKEISEILGDITEDGVKYQLNKLKKAGIIKRIGPDKGGHWEVIELQ